MPSYNPMSLEGKTILVTGASSGIGRAIAVECSRLGASVICTARNAERLAETLSLMEGEGHQQILADLCNEEERLALVEHLPKLDGISHNAGVGASKLLAYAKEDIFQRLFQSNVFSSVLLQGELIRRRKINKGASLVFTSSIAAYHVELANGVYSMTKAALSAYVRGLAVELGSKTIRVNAICPGMVETPLIHRGATLDEEDYKKDMKRYALRRYGQPEEVAHLAAFLLSDASSWITASSYAVDGGRHPR